jgi:hypothetical protein
MKFHVTMKDPDGPYDSIRLAATESVKAMKGLSDEEKEDLAESRVLELQEFAGQWIKYGEYANIEFDTEKGTATLLKPDE